MGMKMKMRMRMARAMETWTLMCESVRVVSLRVCVCSHI